MLVSDHPSHAVLPISSQGPLPGALAGTAWAWEDDAGDRATERLGVANPGGSGLQVPSGGLGGGGADMAGPDLAGVGRDGKASRAELCTPAPGQPESGAKGITNPRPPVAWLDPSDSQAQRPRGLGTARMERPHGEPQTPASTESLPSAVTPEDRAPGLSQATCPPSCEGGERCRPVTTGH